MLVASFLMCRRRNKFNRREDTVTHQNFLVSACTCTCCLLQDVECRDVWWLRTLAADSHSWNILKLHLGFHLHQNNQDKLFPKEALLFSAPDPMRLLLRLVPSRAVLYHVHLDACWHLAADLHPVWSVKRFSLWHPSQEPWMIWGVLGASCNQETILKTCLPGNCYILHLFGAEEYDPPADRQPHEAMWFRNPKGISFSGNLFQGYMMKHQGCKPACWPCVASLDSMNSASYSILLWCIAAYLNQSFTSIIKNRSCIKCMEVWFIFLICFQ